MKRFAWGILGLLCLCACSKEKTGSIYGVVTDISNTEPMRGTGLELHKKDGALIQKTVTFDDGRYEFNDLIADYYTIRINAKGYKSVQHAVEVQAERLIKADIPLEPSGKLSVNTLSAEISGGDVILKGEWSSTGNEYKATENGFYYSIDNNPKEREKVVAEVTSSSFSITIHNIQKGTYSVQAYAKNSIKTVFGNILTFNVEGVPIVNTLEASNVSATFATLAGKIEYAGNPSYIDKGFVYSNTFQTPTIDDPGNATGKQSISGASDEFSMNLSNLTPGTSYYFRTYATNDTGTVYGKTLSFTTLTGLPSVTTLNTTNVAATSATLNGKVNDIGDPAYIEKGFLYSTTFSKPTIEDPESVTTKVTVTNSSTEFSANVSGLMRNTFYYIRTYIRNASGVVYGEVLSFTTIGIPIVETLAATNVSKTSAIINGKVKYSGDPAYTEKGFIYSRSFKTPSIDDPEDITYKAPVLGSNADFSASIDIDGNSVYYVRTYIINSDGINYGNVVEIVYAIQNDYIAFETAGFAVQKNNDISSSTVNWTTANNLCQSSKLGGYNDWRLPTLAELMTIYQNRSLISGLNRTTYYSNGNIIDYSWYWTSTNSSSSSSSCWQVTMCDGSIISRNKTSSYSSNQACFYARCVRSLK